MTSDIQRNRLLSYANVVATVLVVPAIAILLTTTSLRFTINLPRLYEYGFEEYDISRRTGIEDPELIRIGGEIRDYFNSDEELIDIRAIIYGEERPLFTQREIIHMRDVKGLVQGVYTVQWITFGFVVAYGMTCLAVLRLSASAMLAKRLLWGGGFTLAAIAVLGLASLIGFDAVFLKFHQIGFSNDFWKLDPRIHNLIAMFPQGFFLDATLFIAFLTMAKAALLMAISGGYLLWRRKTLSNETTGVG